MAQNYVLLERVELNADTATISFTNIPQTGYTDLKLVLSLRDTNNSGTAYLKFNGVSTGYSAKGLYGTGSAAASENLTNAAIQANPSGFTTNTFGNQEVYIPNYTSSNYKSYSVDSVTETNGTTAYMEMFAYLWSNTAAISSIALSVSSGNIAAYSTASLYGLAAVGTTPAIAPKALGGDITTDGTYWIHTFNTTGSFIPATNLTCDYLVIAGGGAGGGDRGGGGGAGGYRAGSALSVTAQSYAITVGAGGAGVTTATGTKGTDSTFSTITSSGGGAGFVSAPTTSISNGGSGGGGWGASAATSGNDGGTGNLGGYSPVEGYAGGNGEDGDPRRAGGGGGSSAVGVAGPSGGTGGAGTSSSITGTAVIRAGGGGGGAVSGSGSGGTGGGGAGATSGSGTSGTTNTGSGGGGGGDTGAGRAGGNGGSGIVIIRYSVA